MRGGNTFVSLPFSSLKCSQTQQHRSSSGFLSAFSSSSFLDFSSSNEQWYQYIYIYVHVYKWSHCLLEIQYQWSGEAIAPHASTIIKITLDKMYPSIGPQPSWWPTRFFCELDPVRAMTLTSSPLFDIWVQFIHHPSLAIWPLESIDGENTYTNSRQNPEPPNLQGPCTLLVSFSSVSKVAVLLKIDSISLKPSAWQNRNNIKTKSVPRT